MGKYGPNFVGQLLVMVITVAIFLIIVRFSGLPLAIVLASLPVLLIAVIVAVIAIAVFLGWRRQQKALRREMAGLCIRCGYDLRASKDQCPDCGMLILRRIDPITRREISPGK
jgi:hypothetical protein